MAAEIGTGSAEVVLAWVRSRPAVTSTLIGARTPAQLRSNLTSLEVILTPEHRAALDEASTPSLDFPAPITDGPGPMLGFGGARIDGVELPTADAAQQLDTLLTSSARRSRGVDAWPRLGRRLA